MTILRLYENYFYSMNDLIKLMETLKCQFIIISKLKDEEYKKIYDKYFKKFKRYSDESEDENENNILFWQRNLYFPKTKKNYINHIKIVFKKKKNEIMKKYMEVIYLILERNLWKEEMEDIICHKYLIKVLVLMR